MNPAYPAMAGSQRQQVKPSHQFEASNGTHLKHKAASGEPGAITEMDLCATISLRNNLLEPLPRTNIIGTHYKYTLTSLFLKTHIIFNYVQVFFSLPTTKFATWWIIFHIELLLLPFTKLSMNHVEPFLHVRLYEFDSI